VCHLLHSGVVSELSSLLGLQLYDGSHVAKDPTDKRLDVKRWPQNRTQLVAGQSLYAAGAMLKRKSEGVSSRWCPVAPGWER
jgi:hypothetical protein